MGQYHMAVNLTKKEVVHPHKLGDGLKEHEMAGYLLGGVATALVYLLACPHPRGGGDFNESAFMCRWHGDRIALVGDYADESDGLGLTQQQLGDAYGATGEFSDITEGLRECMAEEFSLEYFGEGWMDRRRRPS